MSGKTLKFDNIRVKQKEFHKSKQPIDLDLVNVNQIVVSDKFKHNDDGFKVRLSRSGKFFAKLKSCFKKYPNFFVWCSKMKINEF